VSAIIHSAVAILSKPKCCKYLIVVFFVTHFNQSLFIQVKLQAFKTNFCFNGVMGDVFQSTFSVTSLWIPGSETTQ
jgi:hypothetical protein